MYFNKKINLKTCFLLTNLVSILLIFLKPCEVYTIIDKLNQTSKTKVSSGQEDGLRWHLTLSQEAYNKSIITYVDSYLRTTYRKKRSIIKHCREISIDYTRYVDGCFRHFLCDYLSLGNLLDFTMIFLVEGQKAIYRFTYAITKIHKDWIKTQTDPQTFFEEFGKHSKANSTYEELFKYAFKY